MTLITNDNARARVTAVLRHAKKPLTPDAITMLSGVASFQAKRALNAMLTRECVENVGDKKHPAYRWLGPTREYVPPEPAWAKAKPYRGEPSRPLRPGALDFLECPHMVDGERIERKRPTLMSYRGEELIYRDDDAPMPVRRADE